MAGLCGAGGQAIRPPKMPCPSRVGLLYSRLAEVIDPPTTDRARRAAKREAAAIAAAAKAKASKYEPSFEDWRLALRADYERVRRRVGPVLWPGYVLVRSLTLSSAFEIPRLPGD